MNDGWRHSTWGDEISLEYGKAIRGYRDAVAPFRVFGSNGPIGWTDKALADGPGVILGRKGAYRGVHFSRDPFFVIDTAYYVKPKSDLDMRWLYYAIIHHKLGEIDDGSPIPSTTRAAVYVRDIDVPPLPEQRAIAATLGALDDKIELNRKMNATLEAMARALFRDWFVDFGPTRAKMAGRAPYLSPDLWPLFPARLDAEGKPERWEEKPLTAFFSIIGGGTPKTSNADFWDGPIPWFSVTDTPSAGSVFVTETEKTITEAGLNGSSARLVSKGTTIISARGTVGNLAVAGRDMTFNQSCYGLHGAGPVGDYATYLVAQNMVTQLQAMAHGSVFSTITRQTFESLALPMPSPDILTAFEDAVSSLFDTILANVNESRTLAQTRDLLLPRLMSGELRVTEAEKETRKSAEEAYG